MQIKEIQIPGECQNEVLFSFLPDETGPIISVIKEMYPDKNRNLVFLNVLERNNKLDIFFRFVRSFSDPVGWINEVMKHKKIEKEERVRKTIYHKGRHFELEVNLNDWNSRRDPVRIYNKEEVFSRFKGFLKEWKPNKNYNDEEVWRYINKVIYKWLHPVLRPGNMRYFEESVIRFRNEDFERRMRRRK